MSAKRVRTAGVVLALGALAAAAYWVARTALRPPVVEDADTDDDFGDEEPEADLAPGERIERVGSIGRDVYESFPGVVSTVGHVEVRAPEGMRVAVVEIVKDEGDFVKKGDVLLRFDKGQIERAIREAVERGDEESAKRFRGYLESADLRSPVDGQVKDVWTELGRVPVDVGIPLMTLADRDSYTLRVQAPAALATTVAHMGASLTADLEANLGKATGTVTGYEEAPEGWTMLVIGLEPKEGLEDGLKATLRVPTSRQEVAVVPKAAVTTRGDVKIVRAWEPSDTPGGGSVGERTVLTDGEDGDRWIVVAGVFPGESVVVPSPVR